MKYCTHCGQEIPKNDNFCPYCGYNQNKNNTNTYNPNLNQTSNNEYAKGIMHRITARDNGSILIDTIDLIIISIFIYIYWYSIAHINNVNAPTMLLSTTASKSEKHSLLIIGLIIIGACIIIFSLRSVARTLGTFMLIISVIGIVALLIGLVFGGGGGSFETPYYYGSHWPRRSWRNHWHLPY